MEGAPTPASVSVLFPEGEDPIDGVAQPAAFPDLNLDQVIDAVAARRREYELPPYSWQPLRSARSVAFRQAVFRDLEPKAVRESLRTFSAAMRSVRSLLAQQLHYHYQRESWFLEAANRYGAATSQLATALAAADLRSDGLGAFRAYLTGYVEADQFATRLAEAARIAEGLAGVRYNLLIGSGRVTVRLPDTGPDFTAEIEQLFERFRRAPARDYLAEFTVDPDLNHVGILDRIALLFPEPFRLLDAFCTRHAGFLDPEIARFEREVQFYLAYLDHLDDLRAGGLAFAYPEVRDDASTFRVHDTFDLALAAKSAQANSPIVTNDVELEANERILVVTGPNQGGKTTFARTIGQLAYLASIGCPVPGSEAQLPLADRVLTHFGREERLADQRSRLEDDLLRMHAVLEAATEHSVLVLNEVFTSTTLADAVYLSREVLGHIEAAGALCVWVTFVDELAAARDGVVSLVSNVLPDDPSVRTFKITRRPADGRAYAGAIAAKYGVSYERLKGRLP